MVVRKDAGEKFRGKGGRSLAAAFAAGNVGREAARARTRKQRKKRKKQTLRQAAGVVGQAVKYMVTQPSEMATIMPIGAGVGSALKIAGARGVLATLERNIPPGAVARVARVAGAAALGAAASEAVDFIQNQRMGRGPMLGPTAPSGGRPVTMQPRAPLGQLAQGQEFPGGPFVVKSWDTYPGAGVTGGGQWPIFSLLSDGRIVVQKSNGQWKVYRPKKNLVISSNPRLRDIRKLDRMHRRVVKMMKRMVPRPTRRK
ncbi:MAG: hypothetical protein IIC21_09105 [Chloroflexi bacterium]|nr:hypothetical protein [Chloroflexota bacterium]